VDHVRAAQHAQGPEQLPEEHPDQGHGEAPEVVLAQQLVQVDVQHLEAYAQVRPVHEVVHHPHDVPFVPLIALGV
jgi:hypothetical protein